MCADVLTSFGIFKRASHVHLPHVDRRVVGRNCARGREERSLVICKGVDARQRMRPHPDSMHNLLRHSEKT